MPGGGGGEPGICANDATNYPTCTTCASEYDLVGGQCTPSGTEVCLNGATNPPPSGNCNTCVTGFALVGGQCTENSSSGTSEKQYFCKNPIKGGTNHEMFQGSTETNPDLLLINARNVLSYPKNKEYPPSAGKALMVPVNIKLNCNAIFNSINSDYQKDLPAKIKIIKKNLPAN